MPVAPARPPDEHDLAELITAYREGATAASLATAHGVSLKSVKRLCTPPESAGPRPSTSYEPNHPSVAAMADVHGAHSGKRTFERALP